MASGSTTAVYAAIVGNMAIAIAKFLAAGVTGSSAMLSEGIHSLVDTGNGGLLLRGYQVNGNAALARALGALDVDNRLRLEGEIGAKSA